MSNIIWCNVKTSRHFCLGIHVLSNVSEWKRFAIRVIMAATLCIRREFHFKILIKVTNNGKCMRKTFLSFILRQMFIITKWFSFSLAHSISFWLIRSFFLPTKHLKSDLALECSCPQNSCCELVGRIFIAFLWHFRIYRWGQRQRHHRASSSFKYIALSVLTLSMCCFTTVAFHTITDCFRWLLNVYSFRLSRVLCACVHVCLANNFVRAFGRKESSWD